MSDIDTVRDLIGDTDGSDQILSDTQLNRFISARSIIEPDTGGTVSINLSAAAADAAGAIAAKYAREFNFSEDTQSFQRAQRVGHYTQLADELRNRAGGYSVPIHGTVIT